MNTKDHNEEEMKQSQNVQVEDEKKNEVTS